LRVTTVDDEEKINGRPAYYCQFCRSGHLFIHQGKIYLCINILTEIAYLAQKLPRHPGRLDHYGQFVGFLPVKPPSFSLMTK
jgi:hypothetical protein